MDEVAAKCAIPFIWGLEPTSARKRSCANAKRRVSKIKPAGRWHLAIWRACFVAARRTTMSYTLAEAAAACGLDKSTVRRAVRSGRISGTRNDLGVWHESLRGRGIGLRKFVKHFRLLLGVMPMPVSGNRKALITCASIGHPARL